MLIEDQHAEHDLLIESQFWPAERLLELQRERLGRLLHHARKNVPFYATRLDRLFASDGTIQWDRWSDVPLVRRSDAIEKRAAMLAVSVPPGEGTIGEVSTSGSTGTPLVVSHSQRSAALTAVPVFRANRWHGIDHSARVGSWSGQKANVAAWPEGRSLGPWGPRWDAVARSGQFFEINRHTPAPQVLEFMQRKAIRYGMGGATDMRLLAHEADRLNVSLPLDVVFTRSADVTNPGRELIARVFGARTVSLYSSKEGHRMAHPCPVSGMWHVNDEQVLIEILDDEGHQCRPGEAGRVIVTPLTSFAQPLIRYEQGDIAVRAGPCPCGRSLSTIERIAGRVKHMFVMPDGSRVAPWLSDECVQALNAAAFQVAQTSLDTVEVRYVPTAPEVGPDEQTITYALKALMHADLKVRYERREKFDVPVGRKHIEFVSELE